VHSLVKKGILTVINVHAENLLTRWGVGGFSRRTVLLGITSSTFWDQDADQNIKYFACTHGNATMFRFDNFLLPPLLIYQQLILTFLSLSIFNCNSDAFRRLSTPSAGISWLFLYHIKMTETLTKSTIFKESKLYNNSPGLYTGVY
jgi:hypothetical protein